MPEQPNPFLVGTSGWTYDHWKGLFYPEKLAKSRWFEFYASQFNAVEVNATFYRAFNTQTTLNWKAKAPPGFVYVLKSPRSITHVKLLENVQAEIQQFCQSYTLLEDHLGLVLLQVAPGTPIDLDRLENALHSFSPSCRVAVEFRHEGWYTEATFQLLQKLGVAFCDADSPRSRLLGWLTTDFAYLRLHGRKHWYSYDYSEDELKEISQRAQDLQSRGAKRIYIFFNNDLEGYAPRNAKRLMELLVN